MANKRRRKKERKQLDLAKQALESAGAENFTEPFEKVLREGGWALAHSVAGFEAMQQQRPLWVDLNSEYILPYKQRFCILLSLLDMDLHTYTLVLTDSITNQGTDSEIQKAFNTFSLNYIVTNERMLLFFKDVSAIMSLRRVQSGIITFVNQEDVGESKTCAVCMDTHLSFSGAVFECTHCFCAECTERLINMNGNCPLCRSLLSQTDINWQPLDVTDALRTLQHIVCNK